MTHCNTPAQYVSKPGYSPLDKPPTVALDIPQIRADPHMSLVSLLLSSLAGTALVTAAAVALVRKLMRGRVAEGHNDVLVPIFLTAGTIYAVFLAFLVVAVWESYDAAHANAAEEASSLATLYRASAGMDTTSGGELRTLIKDYTEAVINDEWSIQAATGGASPKAREAGLKMFRLFHDLPAAVRLSDAAINTAALTLLTRIQDDRNKRTLAAGESMAAIMWVVSIGSGVLIVGMTCMLYMEHLWPHALMSSLMAGMICTLLCMTFVLSRPFNGPLALQPDAFEHSIGVYASVDGTA